MFIYSVLGALLFLGACWFRWYVRVKGRMQHLRELPTRPHHLPFGDMRSLLQLYSKKQEHHPGVYILNRILGSSVLFSSHGIYAFWIGTSPFVSFFCPEIVEKLLGSSVSIEKSYEYKFFHKWLGLGILTSTGSKWRSRRKLLTPCFHFRILDDFLPSFHEQSLVLAGKIGEAADEGPVDIAPLVTLCTLDIVCETVMGAHIEAQKGKNCEYTSAIRNLGDLFNQRSCRPWLRSDFLFDLSSLGRSFNKDLRTIHSFTKNVIRKKKEDVLAMRRGGGEKTEESGIPRRRALMDLLLDMFFDESGNQLSEEDILEEVETFMFAGHETTAMALTYALYCIGLYPEVQGRVWEELDDLFQEDDNRAPSMEDVRSMKYLECVIKESQRIFPTVPLIGRKMAEDITHNGFVIPSGTEVHLNIMGLHRRPDSFPDPERFDPDRFLPDNVLRRHPYAYIPFSAGPRNCIGQKFALLEAKVILSNVLRRFRVESLDPRDRIFLKMEFTLKPAEPVLLKFHRRKT